MQTGWRGIHQVLCQNAPRNRASRARWPLVLLSLAVAFTGPLAAGCRAPAVGGPTTATLYVSDYDRFFDDTMSVLRRYDFPPDRADRPHGVIVTQPATSAQWFEFWRSDARGGFQALESNLQTIHRTVTVTLEPLDTPARAAMQPPSPETEPAIPSGAALEPPTAPADRATLIPAEVTGPGGGTYRVEVRVEKARHSSPPRQITTASGALSLYSERTPTIAGTRGAQTRIVQWVPIGRDPLLEDFLLKKLLKIREGAPVSASSDLAPEAAPPAANP